MHRNNEDGACPRRGVALTTQPSQAPLRVVVTGVGVDGGRQWRDVPREPLRQEQVVGHPVDRGHGGVAIE